MASDLRIVRTDTLTDVAFKVCTALDREGVKAVLCGGSAAEVYVPQEYQSGDVDFIVSWLVDDKRVESIVAELGYRRQGRVFVCEDNRVTLDFPSDVLMIWDEAVTKFDTLARGDMVLHVQTPFDTVRDRLCWYFSDSRDFQSLAVAVAVAKACSVDVDQVAEWAARIRESTRFEDFRRALSTGR
jgi:hypothetical protein